MKFLSNCSISLFILLMFSVMLFMMSLYYLLMDMVYFIEFEILNI